MDAVLWAAAGVAGPAALAAPDDLAGRLGARELSHVCPGNDRPAAAAVRGGVPDQLGWLGDAVGAGRLPDRGPDGGVVHAGAGGSLAQSRQVAGGRADHPGRPGPHRAGRRRPDRCAGRGGHRGGPPAVVVPPVRPQRGLPGHLPAGPQRPSGCRRGPRGRRSGGPWRISWAWSWRRSNRSGWPGRPARPRCGSRSPATRPTILFGKLYAQSHLRSDRWYKLGRELLYGRLEDEKPFHTVRRLVQQEDYSLHKLHLAGLPSPAPFGFVELTPEREYLLVAEFFDGAVELGEAEVDDQVIDDGLSIIRKLWDAGPGPPRHQAGQPAGPRPPDAADRRRLCRGPPQPLAAGGGPGQHDAVSGPAVQRRAGLPAGAAAVQRGGDHRGVRAAHGPRICQHSPGRPWAGPAVPAEPDAARREP